jgi:hypothetical protein
MRLLSIALASVVVLVALAVGGANASTYAVYSASLGSHGSAKLTVTTSRTASVAVSAKALARGTWSERLYRGSCAHLSTEVASLPSLDVGTAGTISRSNTLSTSQLALASDHSVVLRLVHGSTTFCGSFGVINTPAVKPVPTPTPTPTPAQPGQSRANPVPFGQPAQVGDWTFAVTAVNREAWSVLQSTNEFNDPPAVGTQYVMIGITATYRGATQGDVFFDIYEHVVGNLNVAYQDSPEVLPNDCSDVGDVFPGGTVTCNVAVFDVPTGDIASLEMYAYTGVSSNVWFALG